MLRSLLFVPGDSEKKLARAESIPADALILDLEDSVAPENKLIARGLVCEYLAAHAGEGGRQIWVRINPIDQPEAGADLGAVIRGRPDGIVQPKTRSPNDVILLGQRIGNYEMEHDFPIGSTRILPVATETPEALFSMGDYVRCDKRLAGLTWGAEDLSAAVGATSCRDKKGNWLPPYELARSLCLFAAAAANVAAIDTVYTDFRDTEGLARYAANARRDGFSGMLAIHPAQVESINEAFMPSNEEIDRATRIVELFAANPKAGTVGMDGEMIDRPHWVQAKRILDIAERIGSAR